MRVIWRLRAEQELARQLAYLASDNLRAAERMRDRIDERMARLAEFPFTGRLSRRRGAREVVISRTPFIAVYRVKDDAIEIVRFFHTSQKR